MERADQSRPSQTIEDYLALMHYMTRDGQTIIGARLAERLGVSAATVTATLQRMVRDGLVTVGDHKVVQLTEHGRTLAESMVRRHALAERLLVDILGMGWTESHEEAHHVEHAITPRIERRLMELLGNPTTCPHGNPIPGTGALPSPFSFWLSDARPGQDVVIERIVEEAEDNFELMDYLEKSRLRPWVRLTIVGVSPSAGVVTVERDGETLHIGMSAASKLRVMRIDDAPNPLPLGATVQVTTAGAQALGALLASR
jgi:DtxR family Mn-dependent transcriptional regulator